MAARPTVNVFTVTAGSDTAAATGTAAVPGVFLAPIRADVVQFVHTQMRKNKRQAYAVRTRDGATGVNMSAGHQCAARSWGTGRAVSRIPRVKGGGTHRAGQGAFGNMCRGGRMFAPTKVFRKWHRKINVNQRRYALTSAIAATALPALVMARGHKVDEVAELPLVVDGLETITKTSAALEALTALGAAADLERVKSSKKVRRGKGKMRNRRYTMRLGPLIVWKEGGAKGTAAPIERAFRNLPGVELCHVDRLNLLQLAPGGHLGRFVVYTSSAFAHLAALYGDASNPSTLKSNYTLPRHIVTNGDLASVINSDEIQSVLNAAKDPRDQKLSKSRKRNPLKNWGTMIKLNPYAPAMKRAEIALNAQRTAAKAKTLAAKRTARASADGKARRAASKAFYAAMVKDDEVSNSDESSSEESGEEES
jgi:large subunit ribosomal protein L4e